MSVESHLTVEQTIQSLVTAGTAATRAVLDLINNGDLKIVDVPTAGQSRSPIYTKIEDGGRPLYLINIAGRSWDAVLDALLFEVGPLVRVELGIRNEILDSMPGLSVYSESARDRTLSWDVYKSGYSERLAAVPRKFELAEGLLGPLSLGKNWAPGWLLLAWCALALGPFLLIGFGWATVAWLLVVWLACGWTSVARGAFLKKYGHVRLGKVRATGPGEATSSFEKVS